MLAESRPGAYKQSIMVIAANRIKPGTNRKFFRTQSEALTQIALAGRP